MHYELWDTESSNVIAVLPTEAEGLAIVRRLLSAGWSPEHLSLGLDFDDGEEGDDSVLPPVQHGAALASRARSAGSEDSRHRA
jgi:hypothetical protein